MAAMRPAVVLVLRLRTAYALHEARCTCLIRFACCRRSMLPRTWGWCASWWRVYVSCGVWRPNVVAHAPLHTLLCTCRRLGDQCPAMGGRMAGEVPILPASVPVAVASDARALRRWFSRVTLDGASQWQLSSQPLVHRGRMAPSFPPRQNHYVPTSIFD